MTNISEFERQKQDRIVIIKGLIAESINKNNLVDTNYSDNINSYELSRLVRRILEEIDKI